VFGFGDGPVTGTPDRAGIEALNRRIHECLGRRLAHERSPLPEEIARKLEVLLKNVEVKGAIGAQYDRKMRITSPCTDENEYLKLALNFVRTYRAFNDTRFLNGALKLADRLADVALEGEGGKNAVEIAGLMKLLEEICTILAEMRKGAS